MEDFRGGGYELVLHVCGGDEGICDFVIHGRTRFECIGPVPLGVFGI